VQQVLLKRRELFLLGTVPPPLNSEMQSIPPTEKPVILVTGGTGYIGSHAVDKRLSYLKRRITGKALSSTCRA
jgi:FlaA1/EpsC-like NDP-sugar epimerase